MRRIGLFTIALAGILFACGDDDYGTTPPPPPPPPPPVATVVTASGDIRTKVDEFRNALGASNGTTVGEQASGRREINWDGVPDNRASPNAFPFNFFNQNAAGTARGVEFTTSGTGFEVSAALGNPTATPVQFGNINPLYPSLFEPFSPQLHGVC